MKTGATILAGAKDRLIPASIPFRYFGAAIFFHAAMWLTLLIGAGEATGFGGGPGIGLAVLHLLTLGVLATSAMGAAFQLLPVATRNPMAALWPARLGFWLIVPGTLAIAHGMGSGTLWAMALGGGLWVAAFVILGVLLALNLMRARDLPLISAHGWVAVASLAAFVGLAAALVADFEYAFLPDRMAAAQAHMILAGYGFMGMLVLGFSQVLVPMFALAPTPSKMLGRVCLWLSVAAIILGAAGALASSRATIGAGLLVGLGAAAAHILAMSRVLKSRMRKRLGFSFVMVRLSWVMLPVSLVVGLLALYGLLGAAGGAFFGFVLFAGWLLTMLLAILQRILPFLAAMHAARPDGSGPLASQLAGELPLRIAGVCHLAALAIVASGILSQTGIVVRAGAAVGLAGALAFAVFGTTIILRLVRSRKNNGGPAQSAA
ncbi:MAG: hypothetical protein ACTSUD_04005 [Alphaproteobacteria bacterium]